VVTILKYYIELLNLPQLLNKNQRNIKIKLWLKIYKILKNRGRRGCVSIIVSGNIELKGCMH